VPRPLRFQPEEWTSHFRSGSAAFVWAESFRELFSHSGAIRSRRPCEWKSDGAVWLPRWSPLATEVRSR